MTKHGSAGFTLIELMITILIASLLIIGFYGTYILQRRSHAAQTQVLEMQQNIRSAANSLALDLRMVGFDPAGTAFSGTSPIQAARPDLFAFAADIDENGALSNAAGQEPEYFAYDLYQSGGVSKLGRTSSSTGPIVVTNVSGSHWEATGHQPVADHIEALEFAYILDDGTMTTNVTNAADLRRIRSVRISLLARTRSEDSKYQNNQTYTTAANTTWDPTPDPPSGPPAVDGFRRRLFLTQIDLRNMGL